MHHDGIMSVYLFFKERKYANMQKSQIFSGFNERPRFLSVVSNGILYCGILHRQRTGIIQVFLFYFVFTVMKERYDEVEIQDLQFTVNLIIVVTFASYFTVNSEAYWHELVNQALDY